MNCKAEGRSTEAALLLWAPHNFQLINFYHGAQDIYTILKVMTENRVLGGQEWEL